MGRGRDNKREGTEVYVARKCLIHNLIISDSDFGLREKEEAQRKAREQEAGVGTRESLWPGLTRSSQNELNDSLKAQADLGYRLRDSTSWCEFDDSLTLI